MADDPLTPEERQGAHRVYRSTIDALNNERLSTRATFSMLGAVLSQCCMEHGTESAHRMVDEFAKTTHQIINSKTT